MTEALPPPESPPEPPAEAEPGAERVHVADSPPRRRRDPLPLLFGIGFIVLLAAVFYLWQHPLGQRLFNDQTKADARGGGTAVAQPATQAQVAALGQEIAAARRQLAALQQQAEAAQQDAATARRDAQAAGQDLQAARQAAQTARQENAALQQRVAALEKRPVPAQPNLAPLEARVAELEKQAAAPPKPAPLPPELANLGQRFDALAGRLDQLAARQEQLSSQYQQLASAQQQLGGKLQAGEAATAKRLGEMGTKLAALEQEAGKLTGLADRAGRVARIQAAEAALDAGLPIGELPGAPPALARFAHAAPPTVASLRLEFPAAAEAAVAAARPPSSDAGFWGSVKGRFESLVTVRRGDRVIVGNPVDATIARAAQALDAGDLAGTVAAVSELSGAPAQAFSTWLSRARALLAARKALAAMAAQTALPQAPPAEQPAPNRT